MLIINNFIDCSEESKNSLSVAVSRSSTTAQPLKQILVHSVDSAFVCAVANSKKAVQVSMQAQGRTDRLKDREAG
jgi:hypothetical protein